MNTSAMYDKLKEYINTRINSVQTSLKTLFNDYRVKEVGNNINAVKSVYNMEQAISDVNAIKDDIVTDASIKDDITTVSTNITDVTNFAKVYLGAKDTDPDKRNNGNDLVKGDLYFNTDKKLMKVYSGSEWKEAASPVNGILKTQSWTGDGSTKEFTVDDGYDSNYAQVYLNGSNVTVDVDISDGDKVKFDTAPDDGDDIFGVFFGSFTLNEVYLKNEINIIVNNNIVEKDADYTAVVGDRVYANTTDGSFTVTLPSDPNKGNKIIIKDVKGTFPDNNLTLDRNGKKINGKEDNVDLDETKTYLIEYVGDDDWRIL